MLYILIGIGAGFIVICADQLELDPAALVSPPYDPSYCAVLASP